MSLNTAADIAKQLETWGYGSTASPNPTITANTQPNSPDEMVTVNSSPGGEAEDTFGGTVQGVENITVLVRGLQPTPTLTKAKNIWAQLHRFRGTIQSTVYYSVWARSIPYPLGRDENNRWIWSCNYTVRRVP